MTDPLIKIGQLTNKIKGNIEAPPVSQRGASHGPVRYMKGVVSATGVTFSGNPGYVTVDIPDSFGGGGATGSITMPSATQCKVGDVVLVARLDTQFWIDQVIGRDFTVYNVSGAGGPGYVNGWADEDSTGPFGGLRFYQDNSGVGHLDGTAARGAGATTGLIFTVPAAFQPLYNQTYVSGSVGARVRLFGSTSTTPGQVQVLDSAALVEVAGVWLIGS